MSVVAGRSFLLTGCASGIGQRMAQVLAREGGKVLLTDANAEGLAKTVADLGGESDALQSMTVDVRDAAQCDAAVEKAVAQWGRLDVAMHIAGISGGMYFHEASVETIDRLIDINTKGVLYGSRAAAKQMVAQGGGHIINIASLAGLVPVPGMSLYSASKFAVRGFSLAIASELEHHNVHVTVVCPDAVATPMLDTEAREPESALSFSGFRILTLDDIERVIMHKVLPTKPAEVLIPGTMAPLVRMVTALPVVSKWLFPLFIKMGRKNQARYRRGLDHPSATK